MSTYTVKTMMIELGINTPTDQQLSRLEFSAISAEMAIRHIRRQTPDEDIEPQYKNLAVRMALYLYRKRGVDGAVAFSENGISRSYEVGDFPPSMLAQIAPKPNTTFI